MLSRLLFHTLRIKGFKLGSNKANARIAVIGSESEFKRVNDILQKTNINADFIGFVSNDQQTSKQPNHIGHFDQINEAIDVHQINEIIFCARDISSQHIIEKMLALVTRGLEFKIAPPESLSIIGSNSIDTAGDLYVIDVNNVGRPENRRNKRLLDIGVSAFLLLFFWLFIWLQDNKTRFLANSVKVLFGIYSWVGYGKNIRKDLPSLKPSVLSPVLLLKGDVSDDRINKTLLNYSKDYHAENDIKILWALKNKLDR
jgi:hypothetical protein